MDEATYYHYLITAVREGSGNLNNVAKLWSACEELFPESLNWEMDAAIDSVRLQGRSLAQIDELIKLIERKTEQYAAESWVPSPDSHLYSKDSIEGASLIDLQPALAVFEEWCAAGNALESVRSELWSGTRKRPKTKSSLEIAMCELCWRTGSRSARCSSRGVFHFYCERHQPRNNNSRFKRANKAQNWKHPDPNVSTGSLRFVFERLRHHQREIPTGLRAPDPSVLLLIRLYAGEDINVSDFPAHTVDIDSYWSKLPLTVGYLSAHNINFKDTRQIIETLDPLLTSHARQHETTRSARLRDMRLLVDVMHNSEAWLETHVARSECKGRGRTVNVFDVSD